MNQELISLLRAAAECSIFIEPTDPGLSVHELIEIAKQLGYKQGEINDALPHAVDIKIGASRSLQKQHNLQSLAFLDHEEPELKNLSAFDFVVEELNERVREDGKDHAQLHRDVIVERGATKGIARQDVQLAITYQVLSGQLTEQQGTIRFPHKNGVRALPSAQIQGAGKRVIPKPERERMLPLVRDMIARRTDGRPRSIESADALAERLDRLGYGHLSLWWAQTVAEWRKIDPTSTPVSAAVLSAALVEAALVFVVRHAQALNLGVFRSKDFEGEPRSWKLEKLVNSAAAGGESAILDAPTKNRTETLIGTRQRIHAGRMLADFPKSVPDLRPEEGRDAKTTAEQVLRRVLDWLDRHPVSPSS